MAIDRQSLDDVGMDSARDFANQPFDSKVMGYRADAKAPKYDPEAAAAFFKGKNLSIEMISTTDPTTKAIVEELQRQFEAVGLGVKVDMEDQSTAVNRALTGNFNLTLTRNYPGEDPDSQYVWWHSGEPVNFGRVNDPELDAALDSGRTSLDDATRTAAYEKVGQILTDNDYFFWNWYDEWGVGANAKVHQIGYYTLPDGSKGSGLNWGWTYWTEVWVDH
jgi:peptide/nickel transport system substrate-binding protein